MAVRTTIDRSSWPTSGSASAGNTGLNAVASATFATATDLPALWADVTTVLEGTAGNSITFKFDSEAFPGSETVYSVQFLARFVREGPSYATDGTESSLKLFRINDASGNETLQIQLYARDEAGAQKGGLTVLTSASNISGASSDRLDSASGGKPIWQHGEWAHWAIRLVIGASATWEIFFNGCCIAKHAFDSTGITASDLDGDWTISLGSLAGLKPQAVPIASYQGGDSYLPMHWMNKRNDWNAAFFRQFGTSQFTDGRDFEIESDEDSATIVARNISTSGVNPEAHVLNIAGAGKSVTVVTTQALGNPNSWFNEHGWFTIGIPMFYTPDTSTFTWQLRNADDTRDILKLYVDSSGNLFADGVDTGLDLTKTKRHALMTHWNTYGDVTLTLIDITSGIDTGSVTSPIVKSIRLTSRTMEDFGVARITMTVGTAAVDVHGISIDRWVLLTCADSMGIAAVTLASAYSGTPTIWAACNNNNSLMPLGGSKFMPNASYQLRGYGLERMHTMYGIGQSGQEFAEFYELGFAGMEYTRGVVLYFPDGFIANDINTIDTDDPAEALEIRLNYLIEILQWAERTGNAIWRTDTAIRAITGGTPNWTTEETTAFRMWNFLSLYAVCSANTRNYVSTPYYDDTTTQTSLFTEPDVTHLNDAGELATMKATVTTRRLSPRVWRPCDERDHPICPRLGGTSR